MGRPDMFRRLLLRGGIGGGLAGLLAGLTGLGSLRAQHGSAGHAGHVMPNAFSPGDPGDGIGHAAHGGMTTVGEVDHARNGFDPHAMLTDWQVGTLVNDPDGRRAREFVIVAEDKEIEVAPGVMFPAWTYNGRVPGPTLRAVEGERLRVRFMNDGSHPHGIHFHGIHSARMDGSMGEGGAVLPGGEFVYEFDAYPFGCHFYHCHTTPLKRHLHKGLYGAFIIDPDPERHPAEAAVARSRLLGTAENAGWQELVMVMNAFDTNYDDENETYAVNTIANAFLHRPIPIERERRVRVYLINATEFDPINSFHLHANFFDYFDHGTTLTPTSRIVDTIMQCQGQRGILEFSFESHEPGLYMFHAHQTKLAELGWMSLFDVQAKPVAA